MIKSRYALKQVCNKNYTEIKINKPKLAVVQADGTLSSGIVYMPYVLCGSEKEFKEIQRRILRKKLEKLKTCNE